MKNFFICLSSFVLLHLASSAVFACSCEAVRVGTTAAQLIEFAYGESQAVFSGKVLRMKVRKPTYSDPNPPVQVTIKVIEIWKGVETEKVIITTQDNRFGGCGSDYKVGESYLIYAYKSESGGLETNQCTRTKELTEAERDLGVIGRGSALKKRKM